jgi:integrase
VFEKALEKAGLRKIRIHDLRHFWASLLIQAKKSLAGVRDQLGHHGIKDRLTSIATLPPKETRPLLIAWTTFMQQSATYPQPKK